MHQIESDYILFVYGLFTILLVLTSIPQFVTSLRSDRRPLRNRLLHLNTPTPYPQFIAATLANYGPIQSAGVFLLIKITGNRKDVSARWKDRNRLTE